MSFASDHSSLVPHLHDKTLADAGPVNWSTNITNGFGKWTKEAAEMENVPYLDANKLIADKLDKLGKDSIQKLYHGDHTHTSKAGALLNAETVAEGIKELKNCDLKKALKKH